MVKKKWHDLKIYANATAYDSSKKKNINIIIMHIHYHIHVYTRCPRRNVPDFRRVFLMLKYTDLTQNTYVKVERLQR
jgi:hypothetical protein